MYRLYFKRVPSIDTDAYGVPPERLADTGATESHSVQKLGINARACIIVGTQGIRVVWSGTKGTTARVSTTDLLIPAGAVFEWDVTASDCYVSVEASDGAATYECFVYTCGR